ncbi:hypothetical protein [Chryseobacterium gambrini]|uniref:Uncharacterized protein n=1 Tax=Chryseobacterium gambrini TaxID=373672 RepID=A0ABN7CDV7_9FLAO|nr:hypothetical protein CRDW_19630 [Chryseobacterium gambrini]
MKIPATVMFTLFCLSFISAQKCDENDTSNSLSNYSPRSTLTLKTCTFEYYLKDIETLQLLNPDKNITFNNSMLNVLFNNEINSFATSLNDLSLNKNFANLSSDSKSFTIGRNIFLHRSKSPDYSLKKISNILSVSATTGVDKNFSKNYAYNNSTNKYDFSSELMINFKFTHIFDNIIVPIENEVARIENYRKITIRDSVEKKLREDNEIPIIENTPSSELKRELLQKKYYQYYKYIADEEIDYLKKNKLYNRYFIWWAGVNIDIPIQGKQLNYKEQPTAGNFTAKEFQAWRTEIFLNLFFSDPEITRFEFLKSTSLNIRFSGSVFNNNSYIAKNLTPMTFQTIVGQSADQQAINKSDLVFIGNYERFETYSLKGEASVLLFNNTIGISGGSEKTFGPYDNFNWKLGIPVSLKDKDEKPLLNFEIQWKEINKSHMIGLSVGYVFGKFTK